MTTHNQFPLLPGSRKCSSMLSAGRKPQKQMKEGWGGWGGGRGVFFCAAATTGVSGLDKKVDMGRQGGSWEAARGEILGTSGQDLDRHRAEVEWPEGKSLVWSGSLAGQRVEGWSTDGHLIWIGSSQPNVFAGSQHACRREQGHTVT